MFKPRFGRSSPDPVKVRNNETKFTGRNSPTQANEWKPVSTETMGFLAAHGKVGIMQVHQRIGDSFSRKFAKGFLNEIDLYNPTAKNMEQIHLFSHLLFV